MNRQHGLVQDANPGNPGGNAGEWLSDYSLVKDRKKPPLPGGFFVFRVARISFGLVARVLTVQG